MIVTGIVNLGTGNNLTAVSKPSEIAEAIVPRKDAESRDMFADSTADFEFEDEER